MLTKLVTPPAQEPLTLDEAKTFLRVEHSHEDTLITTFIRAARSICEKAARISFIATTWKTTYKLPYYNQGILGGIGSGWCDIDETRDGIRLMKGPVASITSLTLTGSVAPYVVPSGAYVLTKDFLSWLPAYTDLLTNGRTTGEAVYVAGEADRTTLVSKFPDLPLAIQMTLAVIYDHRGLSNVVIPPAAREILNGYWTSPTYRP